MEEKNFEYILRKITLDSSEDNFIKFIKAIFSDLSYINLNNIKMMDISTVQSFINLPLPLTDRIFTIIKNKKSDDFIEEFEFIKLIKFLYKSDISIKIDMFFKIMDIDNDNSINKQDVIFLFSHMTCLSSKLVDRFFGNRDYLHFDKYLERIAQTNCDLVLFFYFIIYNKRVFNESIINYYIKYSKKNVLSNINNNSADLSDKIYPLKSILRVKKESYNNIIISNSNDSSFRIDNGAIESINESDYKECYDNNKLLFKNNNKARHCSLFSVINNDKYENLNLRVYSKLSNCHLKASNNLLNTLVDYINSNKSINQNKKISKYYESSKINKNTLSSKDVEFLHKLNDFTTSTNEYLKEMRKNSNMNDSIITINSKNTFFSKSSKFSQRKNSIKKKVKGKSLSPIRNLEHNKTVEYNRKEYLSDTLTEDEESRENLIFVDNEDEEDEDLKDFEDFENNVEKSIKNNYKNSLAIRNVINSVLSKSKTFMKKKSFLTIFPAESIKNNDITEYKVFNKKYVPTKLILFNNSFLFVFSQEIGENAIFKNLIYLKSCILINKSNDEVEIYVCNENSHTFHFNRNNKDDFLFKIGYRNIFNDYTLIEEIACGKFGRVYKAVKNKKIYAIKVISRTEHMSFQIRYEIYINQFLMRHKHKNIVNIIDVYETIDFVYIIMEYIPFGSIGTNDVVNDKINSNFFIEIIFQILSAVNFLHSFGIIHRDIKLQNVLIDNLNDYSIKLIDFGLSIVLSPSETTDEFCGTPIFSAPEVILKQPYNFKCDLWSIGVIAYIFQFKTTPVKNILKKNINEIRNTYDQITLQICNLNLNQSQQNILLNIIKLTIVKSIFQRSNAGEILKKIFHR